MKSETDLGTKSGSTPTWYFEYLAVLGIFSILGYFLVQFYQNFGISFDEGVYLYIGNQVTKGAVPYVDIFDHKPPGFYYTMAGLFSITSPSVEAARTLTLIINILSSFVLYLIGRRLGDKRIGLLAGIFFIVGVHLPLLNGQLAILEPYMNFFIIIAMYFFVAFLKTGKEAYLFLSGFMIGIGILYKQTAVLALAAFITYLLFELFEPRKDKIKETAIFIRNVWPMLLGFSLPLLGLVLFFWQLGGLSEFLDSFFFSNLVYVSSKDIYAKKRIMLYIVLSAFFIIFLGIIGSILVANISYKAKRIFHELILVLWAIFSLTPYLIRSFNYYLLQAMPPLSLLASITIFHIYNQYLRRRSPLVKVAGICVKKMGSRPFHLNSFSTLPGGFRYKDFKIRVTVIGTALFLLTLPTLVLNMSSGDSISMTLSDQKDISNYLYQNYPEGTAIYGYINGAQYYLLLDQDAKCRYVYSVEWNTNEFVTNEIIECIHTNEYPVVIMYALWDKNDHIADYIEDTYFEADSIHEHRIFNRIIPPTFSSLGKQLSYNNNYVVEITQIPSKSYSTNSVSLSIRPGENLHTIRDKGLLYGPAEYLDTNHDLLVNHGDLIIIKSVENGGHAPDGTGIVQGMEIHLLHNNTGKPLTSFVI